VIVKYVNDFLLCCFAAQCMRTISKSYICKLSTWLTLQILCVSVSIGFDCCSCKITAVHCVKGTLQM
jgi:hypothetical protein